MVRYSCIKNQDGGLETHPTEEEWKWRDSSVAVLPLNDVGERKWEKAS